MLADIHLLFAEAVKFLDMQELVKMPMWNSVKCMERHIFMETQNVHDLQFLKKQTYLETHKFQFAEYIKKQKFLVMQIQETEMSQETFQKLKMENTSPTAENS